MALSLTTADLARLETASRLLVSPLAAPDPAAWLVEAGAAVRDLVGGTGVVLQFPTGLAPYFSADAPHISDGVNEYVQEVTWDGTRFSDPVVDVWARLRRETQMEMCTWDGNGALVSERGLDIRDAPIVMDVLAGQGIGDYAAVMGSVPEGEAMVWVVHSRHGGFCFGDQTAAILQAVVPSFRSGLDALSRLGAHRAALDAVGEPLAAFSPDGREIHRTPALTAVLSADPERILLEGAVARIGRAACGARQSPGDGPAPAEAAVQTVRGRYTLRATALPPGLFGADPAALVTVAPPSRPALPTTDTVRERMGLSAREAEVALLLAEGLTNAQLADRLFIAPATARRHTENVLGKLGLTSRAAVASALLGVA